MAVQQLNKTTAVASLVEQRNTWGSPNGLNSQRADLWQVDFATAINGIQTALASNPGMDSAVPAKLPSIYLQSISLPELKVGGQVVHRESRPYYVPDYDEPIEPIRMKFNMDAPHRTSVSEVIKFLTAWRMLVRAGRGSFGQEWSIRLNQDYRIDYAFNVSLRLLRGGTLSTSRNNNLQIASECTIESAWLSSFQLSELNYSTGNQHATVDAVFYAAYIRFEVDDQD